MSLTAEDIRRRLAEASGGLTAEQVRLRLAQAPGAANPVPPATNPTMEQVGASFSKPILESVQGIQDLAGDPGQQEQMSTYDPVLAQRRSATERALEWAEQNQAPGSSGVGANIAGEIAQMAFPASKLSRGARLLTKSRPILNKVAPLTAESAAVGGMEALKVPEEGETRMGNAGSAAAANLGVGVGQKLLSKAVNPQMFKRTEAAKAEAKALSAAGIEPDIPITLGTKGTGPVSMPAAWALRGPLMGVPGSKGVLSRQIDKATGDWRTLMAKKALPEGAAAPAVPHKEGEAPMEAVARATKQFYKDQYGEVLDPHKFSVMSPGDPIGDRIRGVISKVPGRGPQKQVRKKVEALFKAKIDGHGMLTGSSVSDLKTALRSEARLAKDGAAAKGYRDVLEAMEDGVVTNLKAINPEHAARYTALREPYKHFVVLDDAIGRASKGEFQPRELRSAALRHARKNKINARDAVYRTEAQRAEEVYDLAPKTRDSNVFQVNALQGLALGGGAGIGASMLHPVGSAYTGAVTGTAAAGIPRVGQKLMMGEYPKQKALAELLRRPGMEELTRAARIGGGQYLAE